MRPVLVELGPWEPWVLPILALLVAGFAWVWQRLERTAAEPLERPGPLQYAVRAVVVLGVTFLLYFLINRFGPLPIRSYGFMLLLGMLAGLGWMAHRSAAYGLPAAAMVDYLVYLLVGGIVGARLVFVLLNLSLFVQHPAEIFSLWEGGLSFHGGLAGGLAGVALFARQRRFPFGLMVDLGAPAAALGYAFARIGCFLNGCCFGGHCESFWGIRFGPGSEAASWSLGLPPLQGATFWGSPLYPAQLLAAVLSLAIFCLLVWLAPRVPRRGNLFILWLALYGVERFVVEFWRHGASGRPFALLPTLTEAQVASLLMVLIAGGYIALTWNRPTAGQLQEASTQPPASRGEAG